MECLFPGPEVRFVEADVGIQYGCKAELRSAAQNAGSKFWFRLTCALRLGRMGEHIPFCCLARDFIAVEADSPQRRRVPAYLPQSSACLPPRVRDGTSTFVAGFGNRHAAAAVMTLHVFPSLCSTSGMPQPAHLSVFPHSAQCSMVECPLLLIKKSTFSFF